MVPRTSTDPPRTVTAPPEVWIDPVTWIAPVADSVKTAPGSVRWIEPDTIRSPPMTVIERVPDPALSSLSEISVVPLKD